MGQEYKTALPVDGTLKRSEFLKGLIDPNSSKVVKMPSNSIDIFKGDNIIIRVRIKDTQLRDVNLSEAEARLVVSTSRTASQYILRKTTSVFSEGSVISPETGEVVFFIGSEDTSSWEENQYYYQVIAILRNGGRHTVCSGIFNVRHNLEFNSGESPVPKDTFCIDVESGSSYVDVPRSPSEVVMPSLIAPGADTDNIGITNVVYFPSHARVYFSASVQETGWKVGYVVSRMC